MSNLQDKPHTNIPEDLLASSLPARSGPYRSLSAKRPRDPSHRKSVSFNDVPIVHEVPLHDTMRNSNSDSYRSWTYTDATPPIPVISPFSSSQILSPFNSSSAAAQRLHANRLSSTLYSSTSGTTLNRLPDWVTRTKTSKTTEETTTEHNSSSNPPLIIVHTPDERTVKNHSYLNHSQSLPISSDNSEEKKHPYRSAIIPDTEHYRSLPFTYGPLSESTTTYTSMLSTNHSFNDQSTTGHTRTQRARSATLPITITHSSTRNNDSISITPFRPTATNSLSNGSSMSSRTVLKPTTIAFQCSQSTTNNTSSNSTMSMTTTPKPPSVPSRYGSAAAHSRFNPPSHRTVSSTIKYAFANPLTDSIPKPPLTTLSRSRSANVLSARRTASSPVIMIDGQSGGGGSTLTNTNTNLYSTAKRNPNVRQTYGSYYMHRVLLPANTN
jgi:hypothetical protein